MHKFTLCNPHPTPAASWPLLWTHPSLFLCSYPIFAAALPLLAPAPSSLNGKSKSWVHSSSKPPPPSFFLPIAAQRVPILSAKASLPVCLGFHPFQLFRLHCSSSSQKQYLQLLSIYLLLSHTPAYRQVLFLLFKKEKKRFPQSHPLSVAAASCPTPAHQGGCDLESPAPPFLWPSACCNHIPPWCVTRPPVWQNSLTSAHVVVKKKGSASQAAWISFSSTAQ